MNRPAKILLFIVLPWLPGCSRVQPTNQVVTTNTSTIDAEKRRIGWMYHSSAILDNAPRSEVVRLLGNPAKESDAEMLYFMPDAHKGKLRSVRFMMSNGGVTNVLYFDADGRVLKPGT